MLDSYLLIGEIVRPQGIRGEVKVRPYTDAPERFTELDGAFILRGDRYEPQRFEGCRIQKDDVFLKLEGVGDRDAAEKLRGTKLYIDRAHARELSEDEVFIADILGATAYDTQGVVVGTLIDVLTPGGTDVLVFRTPRGTMMMPSLKAVVLEWDAAAGRIVLDENRLGEVALYEDRDSDDLPADV